MTAVPIPDPLSASDPSAPFELVLPAIRETLRELAEGLLVSVHARSALVYLTTPNRDGLLAFLQVGQSALDLAADPRLSPLDPSTDLLTYEVLRSRAPITAFQAVGDRRLSPSVLDALGWQTILALPILERTPQPGHNPVLGLILLDKTGQREGFTRDQVRLGMTFASAVAISLENISLYSELQRQLTENQALHQVNAALLLKLDLAEVLAIVCSEAQRLTGAAGSSVSLLEDEEWLKVACCSGESEAPAERVSVNASLLGLAVRRGEPILINNPTSPAGPREGNPPMSLLAVPLITKTGILGVLDVVNKQRGFTQEDVRLARRYADQAAVAIEHARLYAQSEEVAVMRERQRLARELHDSVNQSLYAISMHGEAARRQIQKNRLDKADTYLNQLSETARDALGQMRLLIFGLRPSELEKNGLVEAIQTRLQTVEERAGLQTGFKARLSGRLPGGLEEELYGITQEALNNVLKHAHASQVNVHLIQSGQAVILKVEDDGVGFDLTQAGQRGGLGLQSMRERAAAMHGDFQIQTAPGAGTVIQVEVRV